MYNRYIPKNDGSFQRRPFPDQPQNTESSRRHPERPTQPDQPPQPVPSLKPPQHGSPVGFLKNLLPKDFDAGDLIVVLLLLLMAGDCEEDQNTALLTLALYFFM